MNEEAGGTGGQDMEGREQGEDVNKDVPKHVESEGMGGMSRSGGGAAALAKYVVSERFCPFLYY